MTTTQFHRPARRVGPQLPQGEISLQEPPALPEVQPAGMRMLVTVLPTALMSGGMMLIFVNPRSGPVGWIVLAMIGAGMVSMLGGQMVTGGGDRRFRIGGDRRDYLRYLSQTRRRVRAGAQQQREAQAWRHPDPRSLWSVAMTSRLWERRPSHPDFGELRVGTGPQAMALRITPLQTRPVEDLEPVSAKALRRFIRAYTTLDSQPVALFVRGFAHVRLTGDPDAARGLVRALLAQLTVFHAPDESRVGLCADAAAADRWSWMKWLPHVQHPTGRDAAGPVRVVGPGAVEVEQLLGEEFVARPRFEAGAAPSRDEPFVLVVNDGGQIAPGTRWVNAGFRNAVLIDLDALPAPAGRAVLTLEVTADDVVIVDTDRVGREVRTRLATPDLLSLPRVEAVARRVAGHRLEAGGDRSVDRLTADLDLPALLGIADLEGYDARAAWERLGSVDRLRVPIGVAADGSPIALDIKESAEGGMGPHGMLIGATGSGKSELLRTLVMALAATHSSETLNFVLVDFKGGATFAGLEHLPHVSAVITNLADEEGLVERMRDALRGELVRRQEILRGAGNISSARDYEQARLQGASLEPLPTLFVVVDEFSELIAAHPDFIELFVMIGRLGRSLGVHLLLASQRIDDGRIHQLEGHLSYRIGLRTFSAAESRAVIGVADAYELPSTPGNGYLRSDVATITRFKAAYVSGRHRPPRVRRDRDLVRRQVVRWDLPEVPTPPRADTVGDSSPGSPDRVEEPSRARTVLDVLASRLVDQGPPAHQVWLPPLVQPPTLDQVMPPLLPDPDHGLRPLGWTGGRPLVVPVGLIDKPFQQLRDLLTVDLAGSGGHVGIAGGSQSGKSTLLRSLLCGLALTCSPRQVQFYCLDFGGGTLSSLTDLPHVGGIAGRHDPDRVTRTVAEVGSLLAERERRFAAAGIDSMADYRLRADGTGDRTGLDGFGDVFLVVDGWFTLRQEFEATEGAVRRLLAQGLNYGIHVVITTTRWSEVHHTMRDQIGTRLELRLGDPVDSAIDLRAAARVPRLPGRGLTGDKMHFLAALPMIDGGDGLGDLAEGTRQLVEAVQDCWSGEQVPPVRTLPTILPAHLVPPPRGDLEVALGVDETRLEPVWHDFAQLPHLTVLGDADSGKTNLLRLIAAAVTRQYGPEQARLMIVDYRRQLFDDVPEDRRLGYAVSPDSTRAAVNDAMAGLRPRLPGADVTPEQLRRRDWWEGPELFVLVDDYDLLAGLDGPLAPLLPYLGQARDIGLHLVVARAAANVMRMGMDPVLRRLQELNTPDLALSCPPAEGPLVGGTKPRLLPPGRGMLCTRRNAILLQTALVETPVLAQG